MKRNPQVSVNGPEHEQQHLFLLASFLELRREFTPAVHLQRGDLELSIQ